LQLIWSAVVASCALHGLLKPCTLYSSTPLRCTAASSPHRICYCRTLRESSCVRAGLSD
jgi:hypothetical protein